MDGAIGMMILAMVISAVGAIYFAIQDRINAKRARHVKLQQEPVNVPETLQEIAKEMKKITRKMTDISQKLQEVTQN